MLPEELLRFFFTNSQYKKLLLIYEIYSRNMTMTELERTLKEPKKKTKRIIESLNEDIVEYNLKKNKNVGLISDNEKVHFLLDIKDDDYVQLKNFLKKSFLKTSGVFSALLFILEKRNFHVGQLAERLSYSESHTYKIIKKVKAFLSLLDLNINLSKKDEKYLQLEGEEITIRLLHYFLIIESDYIEKIKWDKIESSKYFLNNAQISELSQSNRRKVYVFLRLFDSKIKNISNNLPKSVFDIGMIMCENNQLLICLHQSHKQKLVQANYFYEEYIQLIFILNYFIQEMLTKRDKVKLGKFLFCHRHNVIINSCILFMNQISQKYKITEETYYLLIYSLCTRLIVIHYLKLYKFMKFDEPILRNGKLEHFIELNIIKFFNEYQNAPSFNMIIFNFTQVITSYLTLISDTPIHVYIEFQRRPEYKVVIENALIANYSKNVLKVVENHKNADIIISNTFFSTSQQEYFYFRDIFDSIAWTKLNDYLNTRIKKNIIKNNTKHF